MEDPALITAWAKVGLMLATFVICFLIWRGIQAMNRSSDQQAKDREEARKAREEAREADLRWHDEAMAKHDATLEALRALIERTAPPGRAGEAG